MATSIPLTGSISMKQLWETMEQRTYNPSTHGVIKFGPNGFEAHGIHNTGTTYKGDDNTPHSLSEWRGYIHSWAGIFRLQNGYSTSRTVSIRCWINNDPVYDTPTEEHIVNIGPYSTTIVPFTGAFNGRDMIMSRIAVTPGKVQSTNIVGYSSSNPLTLDYYNFSPLAPAETSFRVGDDLGETTVCCNVIIVP